MTGAPPPIDLEESIEKAEKSIPVSSRGLEQEASFRDYLTIAPVRVLAVVGVPLLAFLLLWQSFIFLRVSATRPIDSP